MYINIHTNKCICYIYTHVPCELSALEEIVTWAKMKYKPKESMALIFKKNCNEFKYQFMGDNSTNYLRIWLDDTFSNRNTIVRLQGMIEVDLKKIETTCLPGNVLVLYFSRLPFTKIPVASKYV